MISRTLLVAPLLGALLFAGCAKNEETDDTPAVRKVVSFQGSPDPELVGVWQTADGVSKLDLGKDGTLQIISVSHSQNGKQESNARGKWGLQGKDLFLSYSAEGQPEAVVKYSTELSGGVLKLMQSNGLKTIYRRK